jgi:hypothetical protein
VKLFVTLLALFAICATADAKLTKYWVLKMSINSAVAQYTAYKSREACEREKRRLTVGFKQLARKHKGINMLPWCSAPWWRLPLAAQGFGLFSFSS